MIYTANITTKAKTWKTNLTRTRIKVTKGLVYQFELYLPAGSAGLMGVAVFDGLFQVWPSSVGEFFLGEDHLISFPDMYLKEAEPFEFQVYTYNEDTEHKHFASVRIGLVSKEVFLARFLPTKSNKYMAELLGRMALERDQQAERQKGQLEQTVFEWLLLDTRSMERRAMRAARKRKSVEANGKRTPRLLSRD